MKTNLSPSSRKGEQFLMSRLQHPARAYFFWLVLLLAAGVTTVLVAACGGTASAPPAATAAPTATPTTAPTATSQPTSTTAPSLTPTKVVQVQIVENNGQYSFTPASLTVPKGAQVVWTNKSDAPHTVSSDSNAFGTTSNLMQNQTFMMTFNTAGTYAYHCNIHTYMKGTITVTP
jgi:plastocyanin